MIDTLRTYWKAAVLRDEYGGTYEVRNQAPEPEAILVGSQAAVQPERYGWMNGKMLHYPAIDIDYEARLLPSSTPGHFHLYLDHVCTWRQYKKVLKAMAKAGLIEMGYYKMNRPRKQTFLRKPGVTKQNEKKFGSSPLATSYSGEW